MSVVVRVGGVRGRHEMPVERYLIEEETTDVRTAHVRAFEAMSALLDEVPPGVVVRFYPTGLTAVTLGAVAAFVSRCFRPIGTREAYGGEPAPMPRMEIWEWDREAGDYRHTFTLGGSYESLMLDDAAVIRPDMWPVQAAVR